MRVLIIDRAGVRLTKRQIANFWKRVNRAGVCWIWTGATISGYGSLRLTLDYKVSRAFLAHRIAWIVTNGQIPQETPFVLHRCDNPACVRPDHLFLGTNSDNMADMARKGRQAAKLTEEQVRIIRTLPGKHRDIAGQFGVCHAVIGRIKRGEAWAHT